MVTRHLVSVRYFSHKLIRDFGTRLIRSNVRESQVPDTRDVGLAKEPVLVHSDQGSQFTGHDWQTFLSEYNLVSSMRRRGNCHDNAVVESFFQLLKRERIRRKTYATRQDARADVFNYIEMFYNPKRRHNTAGGVSPIEFEKRYFQRLGSV